MLYVGLGGICLFLGMCLWVGDCCVCLCGVYNSGGVGGVFVCVVGEGGGLIVCQII